MSLQTQTTFSSVLWEPKPMKTNHRRTDLLSLLSFCRFRRRCPSLSLLHKHWLMMWTVMSFPSENLGKAASRKWKWAQIPLCSCLCSWPTIGYFASSSSWQSECIDNDKYAWEKSHILKVNILNRPFFALGRDFLLFVSFVAFELSFCLQWSSN